MAPQGWHDELKKKAQDAIVDLNSDTSVSVNTTLSDLEDLRNDIDERVDALKEQIKEGQDG